MAQAAKKQILLGGSLGREFGRLHELFVGSVAEAVRALTILHPGIGDRIRDGKYLVFSGKRSISQDELSHPSGLDVIRIVPVLAGRKTGGLFQVIAGVVLLVVGVYSWGSTWGPALAMMGAGMAATGAMQMLSPQTTATESADKVANRASYAFNGSVNTEAQGNPVPLTYGEVVQGSAVISGGLFSEDRA